MRLPRSCSCRVLRVRLVRLDAARGIYSIVTERRQLASPRFGIASTPKFCTCLYSNGSRHCRISDHQDTHIRLIAAGPGESASIKSGLSHNRNHSSRFARSGFCERCWFNALIFFFVLRNVQTSGKDRNSTQATASVSDHAIMTAHFHLLQAKLLAASRKG